MRTASDQHCILVRPSRRRKRRLLVVSSSLRRWKVYWTGMYACMHACMYIVDTWLPYFGFLFSCLCVRYTSFHVSSFRRLDYAGEYCKDWGEGHWIAVWSGLCIWVRGTNLLLVICFECHDNLVGYILYTISTDNRWSRARHINGREDCGKIWDLGEEGHH